MLTRQLAEGLDLEHDGVFLEEDELQHRDTIKLYEIVSDKDQSSAENWHKDLTDSVETQGTVTLFTSFNLGGLQQPEDSLKKKKEGKKSKNGNVRAALT